MAEGTKLADAYVQIIPISEGITGRIKDLFKDLPTRATRQATKQAAPLPQSSKKLLRRQVWERL